MNKKFVSVGHMSDGHPIEKSLHTLETVTSSVTSLVKNALFMLKRLPGYDYSLNSDVHTSIDWIFKHLIFMASLPQDEPAWLVRPPYDCNDIAKTIEQCSEAEDWSWYNIGPSIKRAGNIIYRLDMRIICFCMRGVPESVETNVKGTQALVTLNRCY